MGTLLVLYHQPTDPGAFDAHYTRTHIPLAKKLPGLRSYVINDGTITSPGGRSPYYLIAELSFDSMADVQTALSSAQGQVAVADLANFAQAGVTIVTYESRPA